MRNANSLPHLGVRGAVDSRSAEKMVPFVSPCTTSLILYQKYLIIVEFIEIDVDKCAKWCINPARATPSLKHLDTFCELVEKLGRGFQDSVCSGTVANWI